MALPQGKFREIMLQVIYSRDFNENVDSRAIGNHLKVTKRTMRDVFARLEAMTPYLANIDALIGRYAIEYDFERISAVEKNILRLGVFELLFDDEIPPKVALSEAIRLCRKFSTPEGGSFVNGILDAIFKAQ